MANLGGTYRLGNRTVHRMGYGAMQLAGPHAFGPPRDRAQAIAVLREAVALGIDHIDTSDYYGPYVVNEIIHEALYPYPKDLVLVTKLGGKRDDKGAWLPAQSPDELKRGLEDNLKRLNLDVMEVANLRIIGAVHQPSEGSIADKVEVMAQLKEQGLLRHIGLSNVTANQVAEARSIADIVTRHADGRDVRTVHLRIGRLRQIVPDTLLYCWSLVSENTALDGAELRVESVPARVRCTVCGHEETLDTPIMRCGRCESRQTSIVAGEEFLITSLELAEALH